MSKEDEDLWKDTRHLMKGLKNSFIQYHDLVKKEKEKIKGELNLIQKNDYPKILTFLKEKQKKNTHQKNLDEINGRGNQNPVFFIGKYYNEIDKWLNDLITSYDKMLLPENTIPIETTSKLEATIPTNKGPKSSFDTPIEAYSPKELQSLYKITAKTFYSWLKPHSDAIGELRGKRYTTDQVRIIFGIIGEPPEK